MPTKSGCRKCKSPCAQPKPAPKPIPQEMLGLHRIISDTHGSAGLLQNQLFSRTLDQLQRALNQKHKTNVSEHLQKSLNQRTNASWCNISRKKLQDSCKFQQFEHIEHILLGLAPRPPQRHRSPLPLAMNTLHFSHGDGFSGKYHLCHDSFRKHYQVR